MHLLSETLQAAIPKRRFINALSATLSPVRQNHNITHIPIPANHIRARNKRGKIANHVAVHADVIPVSFHDGVSSTMLPSIPRWLYGPDHQYYIHESYTVMNGSDIHF